MAETGMAPDASRPRVFVSYSREDRTFAGRLALVLDDRGFETVIDREDMDAEEAWKARVRPLILSSDQVIVILTANSVGLDSIRWEAELALSSGKRIVGVVPAPLEEGVVLPPPLSTSQRFHFYQHPTRQDSGIHAGPALENALKADLPWRQQYTSLLLLAEQWKEKGAEDLLLRGDALTAALSWRASVPRGQMLVLPVADFLEASEQAEAKRLVPAGTFESRLMHLEERRAAAREAAHAARAKREEAPVAPVRTLTPTQLANLPLAPVHTPSAVEASFAGVEASAANDAESEASLRDAVSPRREVSKRKAEPRKKSLAVAAMVALLMFVVAGAVVWQVVPQYLASSSKVAAADPSAAAPGLDAAPAPAVNMTGPEAASAVLAETSEPAPAAPEAAPKPALPIQTATREPAKPEPTAEPVAPEPAAAAGPPSELADWRAARDVGNIAAWRTYMLKWPKGERRDQALTAVKKRIETLSTKPESKSIVLTRPVAYRELPTFRDKGVTEGAVGQEIGFVDRIASPKEGEWLVLEQEGAWPFRFVSAREIEAAKQ
ncbi:MAG TPA: toll/interleukin-1 receptor domain-containing protein [Hyphomonadaceae bacterium]|nr:toll/interleukin-1 receptor domain-containing protein [Hyphomonadaceae bacterium]